MTLVFVATCVIAVGFGIALLNVIWSGGVANIGAELLATALVLFLISRVVVGTAHARRRR